VCGEVSTGGHSGDVVRDVMLAALENRFGNVMRAPEPIEWLSDNGQRQQCGRQDDSGAEVRQVTG